MPEGGVDLERVVRDLCAEVQRLQAALKDERRQRVFAVAALNQKVERLMKKTGTTAGSDDEADEVVEDDPPPKKPHVTVVAPHECGHAHAHPPVCMTPAPRQPPHPDPQADTAAPASKRDAAAPEQAEAAKPALKKPRAQEEAPKVIKKADPPAPAPSTAPTAAEAKPQRATLDPLRVGTLVEVRCVSMEEDEGQAKWDPARVIVVEGNGLFTVLFDDGEKWSGVPHSDLRLPVSSPLLARKTCSAPLFTDSEDAAQLLARDPCEFSGYLWHHTSGYVQEVREQKWLVLKDNKLYFHKDATTAHDKVVDLTGATLDLQPPLPSAKTDATFTVNYSGGQERLEAHSKQEFEAWSNQLRISVWKAADRPLDAKFRLFYEGVRRAEMRCVVPQLAPNTKPEEEVATLWKRYVVSQSAGSWFSSGDWGRRFFAIHEGYLTMRPDRLKTSGVAVIPLTDTTLVTNRTDAGNPFNIELRSPHLDHPVTLCPDSADMYQELATALSSSYLLANPSKAESGLL